MALSQKQTAEIVDLYVKGDDVNALSDAYGVTPAAIRYQLKKANVYKGAGDEEVPQSDLDLGIDDDAAIPTDASLDAILKNPALAAIIDRAVQARLVQITAQGAAAPASANGETTAVVKAIEHLLEVQSQQMPGYIKPMSADEVDRRTQARVEMLALIKDAQARGDAPHYIIGPSGLFDSTNVMLYEPGQEIRTFLEPVEDFVPMNNSARRIHESFIRSIGGGTPEIGAQVAEAMLASKNKDVPIIGAPASAVGGSRVEIVSTPKRHDVGPQRVLGTSVPETRGTSMPVQAGVTQQPSGPVFVGA